MTSTQLSFTTLTDDQLLAATTGLVAAELAATADLPRCLMEVEARRLYLREGCASMFTYCTQVLHLAEGAAYNRIETARAARRFPVLLDAIAEGRLTLTSARLIAPHLTVENHVALLETVRHKSKREVEQLIAALQPRAPALTVLRKLPVATRGAANSTGESQHDHVVAPAWKPASSPTLRSGEATPQVTTNDSGSAPAISAVSPSTLAPARSASPVVVPLSPDRYKLQVTISADTHDKLRRARDLLRHCIPDGDLAAVLDRALTLLLAGIDKRRLAATASQRHPKNPAAHTRHIPAAVRREVWRRDQGRCAFVAGARRCSETAFLEFQYVVPHADGGAATVRNIELRCRAHDQYEAALLFGDGAELVRELTSAW